MEELKVGLEWGLPLPGLAGHGRIIATNALLVAAATLVFLFVVGQRARLKPNTMQFIVEGVFQTAEKFLGEIAGPRAIKYLPFCAALFFYIFAGNLIGMVPGFVSPTSDVNVNAAMAVCVFLMTFYVGIREMGWKKYVKHKMGPVLAIGPVFFLLETVGETARPVSLTLRLFGNIKGEDIFVMVLNNLVVHANELLPFLKLDGGHLQFAMAQLVMPFVYVLMFVTSFLQAFIFSFLPILYFGAALAWGEEEH